MYTSTLLSIALSAAGSVSALPQPQAGSNLPSYAPYGSYGTYGAPAPPVPAPASYNPYSTYGSYKRDAEADADAPAGSNLASYKPYSSYGTYGAPPPPPPAPASYDPYSSYGSYKREAEPQGSYAPYASYGTYGAPAPAPSTPVQPNEYIPGTCSISSGGSSCVLKDQAGTSVGCDATAPCTQDGNACTFFTGNNPGNNPFSTGRANCT